MKPKHCIKINTFLANGFRSLERGEGDCDSDLECKIGLRCGINNCKGKFSASEKYWNSFDDCCTGNNYSLFF